MSVYENLILGLQEALDYEKGLPSNAKTIRKTQKISSPLKQFSKEEIKEIRTINNMTQKLFASVLGVSVKTVEAWETGTNSPQGSSLRLLECIALNNSFLEENHLVLESQCV